MTFIEELKSVIPDSATLVRQKKDRFKIFLVLAERRFFFSKKQLVYKGKFRIDEQKKEVVLSDYLRETNIGLCSSSGWGFSCESFNTMKGIRKGTIKEQSRLFGKNYNYSFDFSKFRQKVEAAARRHGYRLVLTVF